MLMLLACLSLSGQTVEEARERKNTLEKDIAILKSQISATSSKQDQALATLNIIQAQKESRKKLIKDSEKEIASLNHKITLTQREINRQTAALDTLQAHYNSLVTGAYKNRDVKIWYMYILSSESVAQAMRRFGYFKGLSAQIREQARKIEDVKAVLKDRKSKLQGLKREAQALKAERQSELESLQKDEAQQREIINKLKKDSKAYKNALKSKQDEVRAIEKKINEMLSAASKPKKGKEIDYALATSFEKNKGKLPWPAEGPLVEHYGAYTNKELGLSLFNNGITIATAANAKVTAVFDGVVSNIMIAPGYGQCILIQHGNYYTSYCKVKNATVRQGQKVTTGQVIGEVATITGKTQLYFLVWKKQYIDPEEWLRPR